MAKRGRGKTYPRRSHEGVEYLMLNDAITLKQFNVAYLKEKEDVTKVMKLYNEYLGYAQKWFLIETGRPLTLIPTKEGHTWCMQDTRRNSQDYMWLSQKVRRYEKHIVDRINDIMAQEVERVTSGR